VINFSKGENKAAVGNSSLELGLKTTLHTTPQHEHQVAIQITEEENKTI
jgi:hypothetical protein